MSEKIIEQRVLNKEEITNIIVDLLKRLDGMPGNGSCRTCLHLDNRFCNKHNGVVPEDYLDKGCEKDWQARQLSSEAIYIDEIPF